MLKITSSVTRILSVTTIIMISTVLISCSSGNNDITSAGFNETAIEFTSLPVLVSDYDPEGNPAGGWGLMGLYTLTGNPNEGNIELTPVRQTTFYDTLEVVDITNFLLLAPCTDCAKVESVQLTSESLLQVNVSIKHPFQTGDPLKPISGKNRADLHVFNIEGIVIASQSSENPITASAIAETIGHTCLINADGYTAYLDAVIDSIYPTTATLHPYKLHFRDYGIGNFDAGNVCGFADVLNPTGNLVMAMGCEPDVQPYIFDMSSMENLDFAFAVGCTYAVSAETKSMRFSPEFRIPQHNKKAASEVHVEVFQNELKEGDGSSQCTLHVKVLDMNHGAPVGVNLDEMYAASDVASIMVEVPGVTENMWVNPNPAPISGSGRDPNDPLVFEVSFMNNGGGTAGTYYGLVEVVDSYPVGQNSSPLLDAKDGIKRVDPILNPLTGLFAIMEFSTYAVFPVDVMPATDIPVCDIQSSPNGPAVFTDQNITLDGSGSYDTDGTIVSYEWDFDYDGVFFDVDDTGDIVMTSYHDEGDYTVALRVTDDMTAKSICTKDFSVTDSSLPTDFIRIDEDVFIRNVTIVEDYNGVLHAFYANPGSDVDPYSNIKWAYSTDLGNNWEGHETIYETSGSVYHVIVSNGHAEVLMAYPSPNSAKIFLSWNEKNYSTNYMRVMAGEFTYPTYSTPNLDEIVVHTAESAGYTFNGSQIVCTSDYKIMMYYMQYQGTGWFVPKYKFASSFSMLENSSTPTQNLNSKILNGYLTYIYNSAAPILLVDSRDNILYTISGRFSSISNPSPPSGLTDYNPGYGSLIMRYNNSGDYLTGDNWNVVQHYGRNGMVSYWDNQTQAFCVDSNDKVHWVFEYQMNGFGPYGNDGGDYQVVYATGDVSGQWDFDYYDPIHPSLTDSGNRLTAEFVFMTIDTNSEGEIWVCYEDALEVPEIFYLYHDGSSWQDPIELTVPPMDEGHYPYMFISSWDAMYVVFSDARIDGDPWMKAISTL